MNSTSWTEKFHPTLRIDCKVLPGSRCHRRAERPVRWFVCLRGQDLLPLAKTYFAYEGIKTNTHQPSTPFMLPTYKATLKGNRLEWIGEQPRRKEAVPVHVTVLEEQTSHRAQGDQMAEALNQLAEAGGLSTISDPEAWQREQRQDRALPGRSY